MAKSKPPQPPSTSPRGDGANGPRGADEHDGTAPSADTQNADLHEAIAVALRYAPEDETPRVTAAGRGHVAEQILQIAFDRGIKVRKDADLAQILSVIDIDSEIPVEAFAAVAEILLYVYRANDRLDELEAHLDDVPPSDSQGRDAVRSNEERKEDE